MSPFPYPGNRFYYNQEGTDAMSCFQAMKELSNPFVCETWPGSLGCEVIRRLATMSVHDISLMSCACSMFMCPGAVPHAGMHVPKPVQQLRCISSPSDSTLLSLPLLPLPPLFDLIHVLTLVLPSVSFSTIYDPHPTEMHVTT